MAEEFEVKFRAPGAQVLAAILEDREVQSLGCGKTQEICMRTDYYDTPDGALAEKKWTLRVRQENEKSVVTLKTPGSGYARGEWECAGMRPGPALETLARLGAPQEILKLQGKALLVLCGAEFTRKLLPLRLPDGTEAELCLDEGALVGNGRRRRFSEVELEYKRGDKTAFLDFSRALSARFSLSEEKKSKFVRARQLANGE